MLEPSTAALARAFALANPGQTAPEIAAAIARPYSTVKRHLHHCCHCGYLASEGGRFGPGDRRAFDLQLIEIIEESGDDPKVVHRRLPGVSRRRVAEALAAWHWLGLLPRNGKKARGVGAFFIAGGPRRRSPRVGL